jgi:uncharacterized protein (DUF2267 family)
MRMTTDPSDRELEADLDLELASILHRNGLTTKEGRTRFTLITGVLHILRDPIASSQKKDVARQLGKELMQNPYML